MIKQNKGKDLHKIPKSKLDKFGPYLISKKLDGHYVQIKYDGDSIVQFFTSGGKKFFLSRVADEIINKLKGIPFHVECEYLYGCDGKLGSRGKSAKLTTYRTEYAKGIVSKGDGHDAFYVLDILDEPEVSYKERVAIIESLFDGMESFYLLSQTQGILEEGEALAEEWKAQGYEGAMLKHIKHIYQPGKRTNDIIKLKPRLTADLLCIDWEEGEGKYHGKIGSLLLRDRAGRTVSVGSGLTDDQRNWDPAYFINEVIEIEYEQLLDTYIQPVFKCIREDKGLGDID